MIPRCSDAASDLRVLVDGGRDQRHVSERRHRDNGLESAGSGGHDHDNFLIGQACGDRGRVVGIGEAEGGVGVAGAQHSDNVLVQGAVDADGHLRIALVKGTEQSRQWIGGEVRRRDDDQSSCPQALDVADRRLRLLEIAQDPPGWSDQSLAGVGQPRAFLDPVEQLDAQFPLKALDGLA